MKRRITNVIFSIACCLFLLNANAQNEKKHPYSKEDNISKTYPAAGNSLNVENSFGKVEVITWNSNEIKVDVHIKVNSTSKEQAEKTFYAIKVNDEQKDNTIFFKTSISKSGNCKNCDNNMNIDYTIHLPANTKLNIKNLFGATIIPDYSGELSVETKFGSLTAKALTNVKKLDIEFGSADITSLENVDASIGFSSLDLKSLGGNNKFKFAFSTVKIELVHSLTALNIEESYSTINLKPQANLSASYTINTDFSAFKNRSDITINRTDKPQKYGPDSKKTYEGISGNGSVKINIKSSFGKIVIGEPQPGDIKEKKQKNKNKSKENEEV